MVFKYYDWLCLECGHIQEALVEPGEKPECRCGSKKTEKLPNACGGYTGDTGGGSTRPKGAGAFKRVSK